MVKKPEPPKQPPEPSPEGMEGQFLQDPQIDDMQAETLSGDIRDVVLTRFRSIVVPWAMLSEEEQRDEIYGIEAMSADLVRRAVGLVSASKFPVINVTVGAYKVDKGCEIKLQTNASVANITRLAEHGKGSGVLVLAEAADYFGERAPAKPDKNQREMPFDAPEAP
ncbi:MAG: hypothetical protein P4L76_17925 [Beijerinckiaceae bacterium]|nr:hypothetical protein [Beijerinckiaceae bacterium]